jgi:hypothetical protein
VRGAILAAAIAAACAWRHAGGAQAVHVHRAVEAQAQREVVGGQQHLAPGHTRRRARREHHARLLERGRVHGAGAAERQHAQDVDHRQHALGVAHLAVVGARTPPASSARAGSTAAARARHQACAAA